MYFVINVRIIIVIMFSMYIIDKISSEGDIVYIMYIIYIENLIPYEYISQLRGKKY